MDEPLAFSGRKVTSKKFLWQIQKLTVFLCFTFFVPFGALGRDALRVPGAGALSLNRLLYGRLMDPVPSGSCSWGLAGEQRATCPSTAPNRDDAVGSWFGSEKVVCAWLS